MNKSLVYTLLLTPTLFAQDTAIQAPTSINNKTISELEATNKLADQKLKAELAELTAKVAKLKLEKILLSEQAEIDRLKRAQKKLASTLEFEKQTLELKRKSEIAKAEANLASSELKKLQAKWTQTTLELEAQIKQYQTEEQRKTLALNKVEALQNPLLDDGTLVISDRRISLNGAITAKTADYITSRIHFYNNSDKKLPVFIVIDDCPGGSVMAGYRILKAIEGSDAPIHVVVKSFAASMAATITTLADNSYAYPNAILLHHQISSTVYGSLTLTEQKEFYQDSKKWWDRLAAPIAKKMGISTDDFIKQMYTKSTSGDWTEFATEAKELKWVNTIVHRIKETSQTIHPKEQQSTDDNNEHLMKTVDAKGRPYMILPRLTPKDVYFLYNPDSYYRMK